MVRPIVVAVSLAWVAAPSWALAGEDDEAKEEASESDAEGAESQEQAPKSLSETLKGEARGDYESGRILYADGDFGGALIKFRDAYEIAKDPRLLWNMAACEKNLRHYAKVLHLIERYLEEGGDLLTEQDRADADRLLTAIRPFVAEIQLQVDQPGAKVTIDGEVVGTSPLPKPLRVDMGEREIRVEKPGYEPFVQKGNVSGGTQVRIQVDLKEIPKVGTLVIQAGPRDTILVDGKAVGVGNWRGDLAPGAHRVEVTAEGMQPYDSQVVVDLGQKSTVRVKLDPVPASVVQESDSTWIWVTSGVALAVGLGVGGYLLLRPDEKSAPPPQDGTIPPGHVTLPLF